MDKTDLYQITGYNKTQTVWIILGMYCDNFNLSMDE